MTRNTETTQRQTDAELSREFKGCLATSVRIIDRVIASAYDEALRPLGVRSTQVSVLVAIAGHESPTASDLVEALRIDQTTVSRNLSRLDDQGLIRRTGSPDDRRSATIDLTPAGRRALKKALPIWKAGQAQIRSVIGPAAASQIVQTATRLAR